MTIHISRHNPAPPTAIARAISHKQQQRLILMRLMATTLISAALLSGSVFYARAENATPVKTASQQKVKPEALKKAGEAATKDSEEEKLKAEKAKAGSEKNDAVVKMPETVAPEATKEAAEGLLIPDYQDDRSTPQKLLESYYNAINRKEYARAYSYYAKGQQGDDFEKYAKGYANTQSVNIKLGESQPDPGAGQIYWSVPIAIEAKLENGKSQVYTGCYTVSMSNPAMQAEPPFKPMAIMAGTLSKSPLSLEKSVPEECGAP